MPNVASDPVVQRPLRSEQLSGRAGAPAGEPSGSFQGLLEEMGGAHNSGEPASAATDKNSTKPADTPNTQQAQNGQFSDTSKPVVIAIQANAEIAPALAQEFTAIAEAVTVEATGDKKLATAPNAEAAVTPDQTPDGTDEANPAGAADATTADVAAPVVVAAPVPANPLPAASPTVDLAGIAPIGPQATAPATPADGAAIDAPSQPATTPTPATAPMTGPTLTPTPRTADTDGIAPVKPQATSDAVTNEPAGKPIPADESQKPAALNESQKPAALEAAGLSETPGDARSSPDAAKPAIEAAAEQQAKAPAPHQPRAQAAEHTALAVRSAPGEARIDVTASAGPAQLNASAPSLPFHLAAPIPMSLPTMWPVTALRVDAAADIAIPVAGLAVEIVSRAQDGLRRFDIRLDPPELGRIDVRLDVDTAGKVTSRLVAERAETLDLLRRDAPQLERALQHAGLNTEGGLEFSLRDQNFANREQAPRDVPATRLIIPDDEPAAAEAARRGYGRMIGLGGGVDIRV